MFHLTRIISQAEIGISAIYDPLNFIKVGPAHHFICYSFSDGSPQ